MKKILFIILLGYLSSCKDNAPSPNQNGSGGKSTEYIVKGKLLNGTTMKPINPGMVMTLVVQNNGLEVKRQELGTCKIQPDGSFELKYIHSQLAEIKTAKMRFESQFYISEYLPKNRNLDTILYESELGNVDLLIVSSGYTSDDTLYLAYPDENEFSKFDTLVFPISQYYPTIRTKVGSSGVGYLINDPIIKYFNPSTNGFIKEINSHYFNITGDPFRDTSLLEINK